MGLSHRQNKEKKSMNCGEYYLVDSTTEALMLRAEKAVENGSVVDILRFAA